jgi:hypothetical protein
MLSIYPGIKLLPHKGIQNPGSLFQPPEGEFSLRQGCSLPDKEKGMKKSEWRRWWIASFCLLAIWVQTQAQDLKTIKLMEPNKKGGLPVMEALSVRASVRAWSEKELSPQDLSDLLWAANGINRPDKRRTASSAQNAQDVDLYVFLKDGVYLYDAANHALNPVVAGDHRKEIGMARPPRPAGSAGPASAGGPGSGPTPAGAPAGAPTGPSTGAPPGPPPGGQGTPAPTILVLVSDNSRFGGGTPELKKEWGDIDTGIVSQNIALFCAARGLGTRPRAGISKEKLKTLLHLKDTQFPLLEHPVGYLADAK